MTKLSVCHFLPLHLYHDSKSVVVFFCCFFFVLLMQGIQKRAPQRAADDTQGNWVIDDGSHYVSQV